MIICKEKVLNICGNRLCSGKWNGSVSQDDGTILMECEDSFLIREMSWGKGVWFCWCFGRYVETEEVKRNE